MNKKSIVLFLCLFLVMIACSSFAIVAWAENENEPPNTESDYEVYFVHENKSYPMTEGTGGEYSYMTENLSSETLYRVEITYKKSTEASYLIYKSEEGKLSITYNSTTKTADIFGGSGDVWEKDFDFTENAYYVRVDGANITNVTGKFASCKLSSFYFPQNAQVMITAQLDADERGISWENNRSENYGTASAIVVVVGSSEKNINIKLNRDYLPIDELLKKNPSITLKKNYAIDSPITIKTGEYTIDLGGFSITSSSGVLEIDGGSLHVTGEGELVSEGSKSSAVSLKSGELTVDGATVKCSATNASAVSLDNGTLTLNQTTVLGAYYGISAKGGMLTINGGEYSGKVKAAALDLGAGSTCTVLITDGIFNKYYYGTTTYPDNALSVLGGNITIEGGSFYGSKAINTWGGTPDIKIKAGFFESDISSYVQEGSSVQKADGGYTVTVDPIKFNVSVENGFGEGSYEEGENVTVIAFEDGDSGVFERWEIVSGMIEVDDLTQRTITFAMPAEDVVIRAIFKKDETSTPGSVGTETNPPDTTTPPETDKNEESDNSTMKSPDTETDAHIVGVGGENTDDNVESSDGSTALIILIILLVALLIAAIAVSVILIVRNYRIEREAAERAELGDSIVDSLASQLSALDLGFSAVSSAPKEQQEDDLEKTTEAPMVAPSNVRTQASFVESDQEIRSHAPSDPTSASPRLREVKRAKKHPTQAPRSNNEK